MKKIIASLQPFITKQNVYVWDLLNDETIESTQVTVPELIETIYSLATKYELTDLDLKGPKQYCNGIARQITEEGTSKYSKTLNINII